MRRLLACVVLTGIAVAGCGGAHGQKSFKDPRDLAKALGCESSYESRNQDIGFPQYMQAYGKCTLNGHNAFLTIFRRAGDPARLRSANPVQLDALDHYVSGDRWSVEVPEAKPGEIDEIKMMLGGTDSKS